MPTRTFTFVLEFLGGTYISQYRGRYPREALQRWAERERGRLVGRWNSGLSDEVFDLLGDEQVVPLTGMANAWCASAEVSSTLALLNIIETPDTKRRAKTSSS